MPAPDVALRLGDGWELCPDVLPTRRTTMATIKLRVLASRHHDVRLNR